MKISIRCWLFLTFALFQPTFVFCNDIEGKKIRDEWLGLEKDIQNWFNRTFGDYSSIHTHLVDLIAQNQISSKCGHSWLKWSRALAQMNSWAVQMLDSNGRFPPSGLLQGALTDLGRHSECIQVQMDPYQAPFDAQYCSITLRPTMPVPPPFHDIHQPLHQLNSLRMRTEVAQQIVTHSPYLQYVSIRIGTCTPSLCSAAEVKQIVDKLLHVHFKLHILTHVFGCETKQQINQSMQLQPKQWIAVAIILSILFLVIAGTLTDVLRLDKKIESIRILIRKLIKRLRRSHCQDLTITAETNSSSTRQESLSTNSDSEITCKGDILLFRSLICFSIRRNITCLMKTTSDSQQLLPLHGIRVITMSWVILGHTLGLILPQMHTNAFFSKNFYSSLLLQPLFNATLSVNSFFTITGLLVAFTMAKKTNSSANPICTILFRLIRLWPPYMALICITLLLPLIREGALWSEVIQKPVVENCMQEVWPNLLFLNNFVHTRRMCLMHTWYLSNDFQFFLLAIGFFTLYKKNHKIAIISIVMLSLTCIILSAIQTFVNNYPPTILSTAPAVIERWHYILDFYYKPWPHIPSFFLGFLTGLALASKHSDDQKCKIILNTKTLQWFSVLGLILILFSLFPWNAGWIISAGVTALYSALFRFAWSACLCLLIWSLCQPHDSEKSYKNNALYGFLSWSGWQISSRLSYSMYLLHPIVIWLQYAYAQYPFPSDSFHFALTFGANLLITQALAIIHCLLFESPVSRIQKLILEHEKYRQKT